MCVTIISNLDSKVRLYLRNEALEMYGLFKEGSMNGIGYVNYGDMEELGEFENSRLHRLGCRVQKQVGNNLIRKTTLGIYDRGMLKCLH